MCINNYSYSKQIWQLTIFMKVTVQHTDTVILSTICKKYYDLTLTMASFVCGISEMIPSVIISSTKYLQIRMKIETVEFLVI